MITIDGAYGEGGGQILRTALALAMVTQQPLRLTNIRARRKKPGLLRQHLTAVQVAAEVAQAEVVGASIGAQQLTFIPGQIQAGTFACRIGTAGSTMLVLQTVLPALLYAPGPSTLWLEGGTHNPFAPPFDFLERAFLPLLQRMGARVEAVLEQPGFYPAGGGKCRVTITPASLTPVDLRERGDIRARHARAMVAHLPRHIAEREIAVIRQKMSWPQEWLEVVEINHSPGPGNIVTIDLVSDHVTEVCTGFGQRGVPAEAVAAHVVQAAQRYLASSAAVGVHLADQLLLPLALAGSGVFSTLPLSQHATTNIHIIKQFLPVEIDATECEPRLWMVRVYR